MLKVNTKDLGTVVIVCAQGQIVAGETEALRTAVNSINQAGKVILDLSRVTTVDAHGLGVMLELRARLLENGVRFALMNVSKPLSRILEITRLNSVFETHSAVEFFPHVSAERRISIAALKSCA